MKTDDFFEQGPFKEARENVMDFTMGMYYAYCFEQTMIEFERVQGAYLTALSSSDEQLIEKARSELSYYENIITLASTGIFQPAVSEDEPAHD